MREEGKEKLKIIVDRINRKVRQHTQKQHKSNTKATQKPMIMTSCPPVLGQTMKSINNHR